MAEMVDKLFRIHARKHGLDAGESMERLELRKAAQAGPAHPEPSGGRDPVTENPSEGARKRIDFGSGKRMRKPEGPGAPDSDAPGPRKPAPRGPAASGRAAVKRPGSDPGQMDLFAP
jgi:hypothetical protein